MPIKDESNSLETLIASIKGQTFSPAEIIIIDGGSNDGTLEIIKSYNDFIDYWVSEPDNGIYDAMNKGVSFATGDIVGILNSDDFFESPDTVQNVVNGFCERSNGK